MVNIDFKLSDHFKFSEFIHTDTGLYNIPSDPEVICNLKDTAILLEELRGYLGYHPIYINSGYRSTAVNKAVGGVSTSDHLKGFAVDIVVDGMTPREVFDKLYCLSNRCVMCFGQVICYSTFVHVSFNTFKHFNEFTSNLF